MSNRILNAVEDQRISINFYGINPYKHELLQNKSEEGA